MTLRHDPIQARARLRCSVERIDEIFTPCLRQAEAAMTPEGVASWIDGASRVCGLGRGTELVLIWLEGLPEVARLTDDSVVAEIARTATVLSGALCGKAINPFLSTLPAVARRLESADSLRQWLALVERMSGEAGEEALIALLHQAVPLLHLLTIDGLLRWAEFGLAAYRTQDHRYPEYFGMQTADAHAMMQRQRQGTLLVDAERQLKASLRAMWDLDIAFQPYSTAFDALRKPVPHLDKLGLHLPDVQSNEDGEPVSGIDRYRATTAHLAAHKIWSRPYLADNFSPFQHLAVEAFEDARVEALAMRRYPGLRRLWQALHPIPKEGACPEGYSAIRHKLAMLSRALLDPDHPYTDPLLKETVAAFHEAMKTRALDPDLSAEMGRAYLTEIHDRDFHSPKVWFEDTVVPYRDDNRYLWHFLEDADSADDFTSDHGTPDVEPGEDDSGDGLLPPQHYPEWDYRLQSWRPDWNTVFEGWAPSAEAGVIDNLIARNTVLARRIKQMVDRLKPQNRRRVRMQTEGEEFDLDRLIGAVVDLAAGTLPDGRVYQRYEPDRRDIAVLLLLDLSESLNKTAEGAEQTLLAVSQEAVSLLAWAEDRLQDPFAIAGFASDTRHQVRYTHYKTFNEPWDPVAKARLAGMTARDSTRMGAGLRHASRYLDRRREEKKLLLLLSDGRPFDIDEDDPEQLKADTKIAVSELKAKGITTFCVTLDPKADDYAADIFGANGYAVVDKVERLPETLSRLFMMLTG